MLALIFAAAVIGMPPNTTPIPANTVFHYCKIQNADKKKSFYSSVFETDDDYDPKQDYAAFLRQTQPTAGGGASTCYTDGSALILTDKWRDDQFSDQISHYAVVLTNWAPPN